jgi:hypothetical protein
MRSASCLPRCLHHPLGHQLRLQYRLHRRYKCVKRGPTLHLSHLHRLRRMEEAPWRAIDATPVVSRPLRRTHQCDISGLPGGRADLLVLPYGALLPWPGLFGRRQNMVGRGLQLCDLHIHSHLCAGRRVLRLRWAQEVPPSGVFGPSGRLDGGAVSMRNLRGPGAYGRAHTAGNAAQSL